MEFKFLLLVVIPLSAVFGSTEANRNSWPHYGNNNTFGTHRPLATPPPYQNHGGNNTGFIPFRRPITNPPPSYNANSFGASNSPAPPPRWSGPYPTPVGHGQHGHNEHRYPSYNRTTGTTPNYGQNSNQFGNSNNSTSLYPSLAGLGHNGNNHRLPVQGGTGAGSSFPYIPGQHNYNSGGNGYRPPTQSGTGAWNGTAGSNFPNQQYNGHHNYQHAHGNEYRPVAQGGTGSASSNFPHQQFNEHLDRQNGMAHYNRTDGRRPVNSGYGNQGY